MEESAKTLSSDVGLIRILAETLRRTQGADGPSEPLAYLCEQACTLLEAATCAVFEYHAPQQVATLLAGYGVPRLIQETDQIDLTNGAFSRFIVPAEPVVEPELTWPDAGGEGRSKDLQPWQQELARSVRAALVMPVRYKDVLLGGLAVYFARPQSFSVVSVEIASVFAEQAGLILQNTRLAPVERLQLADMERRHRVAKSLQETLRLLNQDRPLQEILDHVVYQAKTLLDAGACVLHRVDMNTGMAFRQASAGWPVEILTQTSAPYTSFGEDYRRILYERVPVYGNYGPMPDRVRIIEEERSLPEADRRRRMIIRSHFAGVLGLPMQIKSQVYGCMLFYYTEPQDFSDEQVALASMFVEQAALAIENARLHQAEQARRLEADQRRKVAEGLRDILAILNSSRSLKEILNYIVMQAANLLDSEACVLYRFDREQDRVNIVAASNVPAGFQMLGHIPLYQGGAIQKMLDSRPALIPDIRTHLDKVVPDADFGALDPGLGSWLDILYQNYRAYLGVPLTLGNELYGCLALYYVESRQFTEEEVGLALAFSDQAALALENARLYDQVQETAAVAERNRLARDLHDSVTQTLFSASLIAKVLPRLWDRDETEGRRRLEELHLLTRGALAEMRNLLLELRPAALTNTDLHQLCQQLVDAAIGRGGIPIDLIIVGKELPELKPDVKLALYRIAQEALNNVTKHADAEHAEFILDCNRNQLTLVVKDNGLGFDVADVSSDHFGLAIMQERARQIGGHLTVESQPGEGTRVRLVCPCPVAEGEAK